jgi:hypothetical protein
MLPSILLLAIPLVLLDVVLAAESGLHDPRKWLSYHRRAKHRHPADETDAAATSGNLTYVLDSGVCETTEGVHQVSGYINVTPDDQMVRICLFSSACE